MQRLNKFQSRSGMTLVEIVITLGILGGIGLIAMRYVENASKHSRYLKAKSELEVIHNSYVALLRNPDSCVQTFYGKFIGQSYLPSILSKANDPENKWAKQSVNPENGKIVLKSIQIYSPTDTTLPLQAPKPEATATENGWVTTVAFHYEMYKSTSDEGNMSMAGSEDQVRYISMTFDNFKLLSMQNGKNNCKGANYYYKGADNYGTVGCFDASGVETSCPAQFNAAILEYGACYNTSISNPILKCSVN